MINVQKKVWQAKGTIIVVQEKEDDQLKASIKSGKQVDSEITEGWKEVRGKSDAKTTHVTGDGHMSIINDFTVKQGEQLPIPE